MSSPTIAVIWHHCSHDDSYTYMSCPSMTYTNAHWIPQRNCVNRRQEVVTAEFQSSADIRGHKIGSIRTFHLSRRLSKMENKTRHYHIMHILDFGHTNILFYFHEHFSIAGSKHTGLSESWKKKTVSFMSSDIRWRLELHTHCFVMSMKEVLWQNTMSIGVDVMKGHDI